MTLPQQCLFRNVTMPIWINWIPLYLYCLVCNLEIHRYSVKVCGRLATVAVTGHHAILSMVTLGASQVTAALLNEHTLYSIFRCTYKNNKASLLHLLSVGHHCDDPTVLGALYWATLKVYSVYLSCCIKDSNFSKLLPATQFA